MFEKQYPKAMTMRKGILIAGCTFVVFLMFIMVMNWRSMANRKHHLENEATVSTVASASDKQWFVNAQPKPQALIPPQTLLSTESNVPESVKTTLNKPTAANVQKPALSITQTAKEQSLKREAQLAQREMESAMRAPIKSNMLTPQPMGGSQVNSFHAGNNRMLSTDDPNEQGEKKSFLQEATSTPTNIARLQDPITAYELKAGTVIPGVMISGINSDLPGFITAQVRQSVYDTTSGRYLLLPQGSKLFGQYDSQVVYGQERVLVVWNQVTFPNGQTLDLAGMPGTDMSGYAGFIDQVNNHYLKIFGSVLLMSVMTSGAQLSQPANDNTNTNTSPNVLQTMAATVGTNSAQTMNMMTRKNLNIQPTLEIRPGYLFNIVVTKNMVFPSAYRGESQSNVA